MPYPSRPSSSSSGGVTFGLVGDIQPLGNNAGAGASGRVADAAHVHPPGTWERYSVAPPSAGLVTQPNAQFTTLTTAIAAAVAEGHDPSNPALIMPQPGTYNESINLPAGIYLIGPDGFSLNQTPVNIAGVVNVAENGALANVAIYGQLSVNGTIYARNVYVENYTAARSPVLLNALAGYALVFATDCYFSQANGGAEPVVDATGVSDFEGTYTRVYFNQQSLGAYTIDHPTYNGAANVTFEDCTFQGAMRLSAGLATFHRGALNGGSGFEVAHTAASVARLYNVRVSTTADPVFIGAGTIQLDLVEFDAASSTSGSIASTLTQTPSATVRLRTMYSTATASATFNAGNGEYELASGAGGAAPFARTLPAVNTWAVGRSLWIENADSSGGVLTISRAGADTIGTFANTSLTLQKGDVVELTRSPASSTNWVITNLWRRNAAIALSVDSSGAITSGAITASGAILAAVDDATNAGLTTILTVRHTTSGVAANGIGAAVVFQAENTIGTAVDAGKIAGLLTNAANTTEASALGFYTRTGGGALTEYMRLGANGGLVIGSAVVGNAIGAAGVGLQNNTSLYTRNVANSAWEAAVTRNVSDQLVLGGGATGSAVYVQGTAVNLNANPTAGTINFSWSGVSAIFGTDGSVAFGLTNAVGGIGWIGMPNTAKLRARNAAGSAYFDLISSDASDNVLLGEAARRTMVRGVHNRTDMTETLSGTATASATKGHHEVDTSGGAANITLPLAAAGVSINDIHTFGDKSGTWNTNNFNITPGAGETINGSAATITINTQWGERAFVKVSATNWRYAQ